MMFSNLLTPYAIEVFLPIAKWLAIGVVAAVIVLGAVIYFVKKDFFSKYIKGAFLATFIFLALLGITCLVMEIAKKYGDAYITDGGLDKLAVVNYILIPLAAFLGLVLLTAVVTAIVSFRSKPENKGANTKKCLTVFGIIDLLSLIVLGVLLAVYYEQVKEWYGANQPILYVAAALLVVIIVALAFILDKNDKAFDTKCIALAGITVAMSFGLSYVTLWKMPQGGSITLISLLPIMIFSNIYGTKKGVLVCFIYGVLQAIQDPWLIHPAQFLLDYPVAFAAIGLSGAFNRIKALNKLPQVTFLLGGLLGGSLRFISHVLSGVFAFATYAGDMNPWVYSMAYNSFVFIDIALVLVIGAIIYSSKSFMNEVNKISAK